VSPRLFNVPVIFNVRHRFGEFLLPLPLPPLPGERNSQNRDGGGGGGGGVKGTRGSRGAKRIDPPPGRLVAGHIEEK